MSKALYVPLQLSLGTALCLSANPLLAQVTPDGTINTQVNQNGNVAEITGGETRGGNLFHSFQDFSVQTGNEAFFNNTESISNIFSRVTGGNISNIDGIIRTNGSASLFLINPAGIVFGENARLNIGGSFYGSTASSILFEDGEFSAVDNLEQPILTVSAPIGLGFRDNPGDIINRAATGNGLEVTESQNISLVGGNVTIENGGITFAPGGRVELGGLLQVGTIDIAEDNSLVFPDDVSMGDVSLTDSSIVAVSFNGGGSIGINANNFELFSGSQLRGGISTNNSFPDIQAGDIVINTSNSVLVDAANSDNETFISNSVVEGLGNAGNIEINAPNISFINGGYVLSQVQGTGNTGDINLSATQSILFEGQDNIFNNRFNSSGVYSVVNDLGIGNTGNINITSQNLSVTEGAQITTRVRGEGSTGNINIDVDETVLVSGGFSTSIDSTVLSEFGNTGGININTQNLTVAGGSQISSTSLGNESTGDINITATDTVLIEREGSETIGTGSQIIAEAEFGTADASNITIETSKLLIDNSGSISTSNFNSGASNAGDINISANLIELRNNSFIDAFPSGSSNTGNGGTITINSGKLIVNDASQISVASSGGGNSGNLIINSTDSIELSGAVGNSRGGLIASAVNSGNGGTINLTTGELSISDGATIIAGNTPSFAENSIFATGTGQPGNINIQANTINLDTEGRIEAATQSEIGEGANIDLQVTEDITLRNNSFISARAFNNADGGNLNIDARFVVAFPSNGTGNDLVATAEAGNGGNINLNVEQFFGLQPRNAIDGENSFLANNTNDIDVSGDLAGEITINTNDVDPVRRTTELPSNIVVPEQTSQQACEANRELAAKSGLTIEGKGGIVPDPGEPLDSLNAYVNGESTSAQTIPAPIETVTLPITLP